MQSELAYAVREPAGGGSMPNVIYNTPPRMARNSKERYGKA